MKEQEIRDLIQDEIRHHDTRYKIISPDYTAYITAQRIYKILISNGLITLEDIDSETDRLIPRM